MRLSFKGMYPVTRPFGVYDPAYANYPNSRHPGTDFGLPTDTLLIAGMAGIVTVHDRDAEIATGRGKEVVITRGNYQRKYCHMNHIDVQDGQEIREGQPIGKSGYTGYVVDADGQVGTPGGAHLHDELLIDGTYVPLVDHLQDKEDDMPNEGDVHNVYLDINGRKATADEVATYTSKSWNAEDGLYYGKIQKDIHNLLTDLRAQGAPVQLQPGVYEVK